MSDAPEDAKWPREIFAAEIKHDEHEVTGIYVTSEFATVARYEGDAEREREFQRYVDGDIYDSAEKYWKNRADIAEARIAELESALRNIGVMAHSDTCSTQLTFMGHACDCHVECARDALKETPDD
jgi:hypothetical protein